MPLMSPGGLQPTKASGADVRYLLVGSSTRAVLLHTPCTQLAGRQLIHELA